jgi:hypothetical protein
MDGRWSVLPDDQVRGQPEIQHIGLVAKPKLIENALAGRGREHFDFRLCRDDLGRLVRVWLADCFNGLLEVSDDGIRKSS